MLNCCYILLGLQFVVLRCLQSTQRSWVDNQSVHTGSQEVSQAGRTANTASVLRETHLYPLLDLLAKQHPQRLTHTFLKARIMLVQTTQIQNQ
jgi:hypothetical protein